MKKIKSLAVLFVVLTIVVSCFVGCGAGEKVKITDHEWQLSTAQNENGDVIARSQEYSEVYTEAEIKNVILTADENGFTIKDLDMGESYSGEYKVENTQGEGVIYEITINGKTGNAGCAPTTYKDGAKSDTLTMAIDGYSLTFYAKQGE